jgi:polyribonucleotide nucleotidyltransferase
MEKKTFSCELGGQTLSVSFSKMAQQASRSLLVQQGDTVALVTATMSKNKREGIDFFPLVVDFEEKFYAAGKFIGSRFIKREGRPSEEAILSGRMTDRALRPLFNQNMRNEVQVVITVLSMDEHNDADVLGMVGASIALASSDIPWNGPIGALRVAYADGKYMINPSFEDRARASLDLVISGTPEHINMLEGKAKEVPEDIFFGALEAAQKPLAALIDFQKTILAEIHKEKAAVPLDEYSPELVVFVKEFGKTNIEKAVYEKDRKKMYDNIAAMEKELKEAVAKQFPDNADASKQAVRILDEQISEIVHENILKKERRVDDRKLNEIRGLEAYVSLLPRTHGSALFVRGTTQALSVVTLGSPGDVQTIDTLETSGTKRFMHHYNFPPYATGETGRLGSPGRREIGHGALAEKALEPIIPSKESFPYTIRVVSEILSSNGSSSMASVCGSTLALMDAGVPITKPAAGIAMGLMSDDKGNYKVLTDIQGPEDHHGDMDFKAAGTRDGLTAIQMDVKITGVGINALRDITLAAKEARTKILAVIESAIKEPRKELSQYAPRIVTIKIPVDKIREVIGPGGKVINEIIEKTGVTIDIEQTGDIFITSTNQEGAQKAIEWINGITKEPEIGEIYTGPVTKIAEFGAFIEILPNKDGLLHISEITNRRLNTVSEVLKEGQVVTVKVIRVDRAAGKVSLTMINVPQK